MMNWLKCLFEPLDVFAAADARRLDQGGWGHEGEIAPAAFAGALRTLILEKNGYVFGTPRERQPDHAGPRGVAPKQVGARLGVPDSRGMLPDAASVTFRFAAPLMTPPGDERILWPLPRCVLGCEYHGWHVLAPELGLGDLSDEGLADEMRPLRCDCREAEPLIAYSPVGGVQGEQAGLYELMAGTAGEEVPGHFWSLAAKELFRGERRHGHVRAASGVVAEGGLFSRACVRLIEEKPSDGVRRSVGFVGLLGGADDLIDQGEYVVRLGGDGHLARLRIVEATTELRAAANLKPKVTAGLKCGDIIRLYLATPAIFENGWKPPFHEEHHGVRLIAAAVDKPRVVSGWDYARRRPKSPQRAVPAGGTYFYEVTAAEKAVALIEQHHLNESICGSHGYAGYGLALFGCWKVMEKESS